MVKLQRRPWLVGRIVVAKNEHGRPGRYDRPGMNKRQRSFVGSRRKHDITTDPVRNHQAIPNALMFLVFAPVTDTISIVFVALGLNPEGRF
jgi:hypothetical protein